MKKRLHRNFSCKFIYESLPNIPKIAFEKTPQETLRTFLGECAMIDLECRNINDNSKRYFTKGCTNCFQFQPRSYRQDRLVHYVNLSMYPAPCQCRCIYCDVYTETQNANTEKAAKAYNHLFDILELALDLKIIADDAVWQISSGEIAIHPYHDRIMNIVKGRIACFYTNCMKFDEDIAKNLHDNPKSTINLSIDSGTPETWRKIKGLDNFDKVIENLSKYYVASTPPGQITLKYIVMPGINDNYEDFTSVIEIMKVLKVNRLIIARDGRKNTTCPLKIPLI